MSEPDRGAPEPDETRASALSDESLLAQCRVETFRSGGPGGQHQNKTETGVRLTHVPSGIVVSSRRSRSQSRNRSLALATLRRRLEEAEREEKPRRRTRPTRASRERRREHKRRRAERKRGRRKPGRED